MESRTPNKIFEVVYCFCHAVILTGVYFQGEVQHVGDVSEAEIKY